MKLCSKCKTEKPLTEYGVDNRRKDRRFPQCKDCRRECTAAYRETRRDELADKSAAYARANPHIHWESGYRRRIQELGLLPLVVPFTQDELKARYGDKCFHCDGPFESLDHFPIPVSRGGEHTIENCRPSCNKCQASSWRDGFIAKRNPAACKQYGVSESPSKTQTRR